MNTPTNCDPVEVTAGAPNVDRALPVVAVLIPYEPRRHILSAETEQALASFANVVSPAGTELAAEELPSLLDGAVACLTGWGSPPLGEDLVIGHRTLQLVAHTTGSIRHLVPVAAIERGLRVSHAAVVIADAVAELVVSQALLCLRQLHEIDRAMKADGGWQDLNDRYPGRLLGTQTVGIVGFGYVGRIVARLFAAFGCQVLVYDPLLTSDGTASLEVETVCLNDLFAGSDIVTIHAPALPQTHGMIDEARLSRLRDGAIFINTARAILVDEAALLRELQTGRITAALDVFGREPLPTDSPFRQLPNVILSPHLAGHTVDTHRRQGQAMVDEVRRLIRGERLRYQVMAAALSTMA